MLKTASKPVDVQDLQFKLQCRLNIFDKQEGKLSKTSKSLLASASRYGLVFVGCISAKLKVLSFENIEGNSSTDSTKNYLRREVNLIAEPYYICVNCDHTILAVVVQRDDCLNALFYDVLSFYKENIILLNEIRLTSTPGLEILQATWHPTMNNIFTECKSDGTLGIYELNGKSLDVKKLPAESKACCFCWSPKGKQIAVGSQNGTIIHYKPDLKAVKSIEAPPFDKPHSMLSLQWISNYQFIGVFKLSQQSDPECSVVLIDAPKTGNPVFTNFYDICYSNGNFRPPQFYLIAEQHWNIVLVASANSMEVGVLSNTGEIWTQCILPDSARVELPLDENQDETFPIGMAVDTSSDKPVLWGESYLQPAPSLILLSHEGMLCCFKMINLKEGAPSVNSPVETVSDLSGLGHFVGPVPEATQDSKPQEVPNLEEPSVSEDTNTTTADVAPPPNTNPPGVLPSPFPTLTSAPAVPSSQIQQTPTTPISIFKSTTLGQPMPSAPTNLFGGQVSITPIKSKEATTPSSTASVGAALLSNMLSEGGATQRKEMAPPPTVASVGSMTFSNMLSGSLAAQTKASLPSSVSVGSGTANRSSGSVQVQTGNYLGTGFPTPPSSGSGQVQTGNYLGTGFTTPLSSKSGQIQIVHSSASKSGNEQVQTGNQPPASFTSSQAAQFVPNTTVQQVPVMVEKIIEEEESEEIKGMLTKMVQMECLALDKEIKYLITQGRHLKIPLNPNEMDQIVQNTEDINEFLKELVETCEVQSSEIHILKQNTIQSWAWVEEARSRFKESQDEDLRILMKSRPLDSVSEKHLSTLKQMRYYLNSQMKQSHKALDDQWDKFQDYCRKNNKFQLPTMEAIFQTMVKQNAVLQKHNYILKDITSQIRGKQKASNHAALFNPLDKKDNLESSFQNLKLEPENINHIYYQKVLNRIKSVPANKTIQLRRILHNREVPHVMIKSQLSTSALNSSLKTNQQTSACLRTPLGKKLEESSQLYQSTPLNLSPELGLQISSTPLSAFVPTSNLAHPQVSTRLGVESQRTIPASNPNFNKKNVSTFTNPSFLGDKQSAVPQSQNSLFKTPTIETNQKIGYNASTNFGLNQDTFGTNKNPVVSSYNSLTTPTIPQTKFGVSESSVSTTLTSKQFTPVNPSLNSNTSATLQNLKSSNLFGPSANAPVSSTQASTPVKMFSFVSSTGQAKELPDSTSVSSGVVGTSAPLVCSGMVPSSTFGSSSFFNNPSNTVSAFGKSSSVGLFGSSANSNVGIVSTPSLLPGNSSQKNSGFGTSATNNGALSIGVVSKTITTSSDSIATKSESIFGTAPTSSGDNSNSAKPLLTSLLSPSSVSTADPPKMSTPATSGSVPPTGKSIFGSPAPDGGSILTTSPFQFGTPTASAVTVQPKTPSIFGSSSKEEDSIDDKTISTSSSKITEAVSADSKSIFGAMATSTGEVSSSGKSIFDTAVTIGGVVSSSSNSIFGTTATNVGVVSSDSKPIFGSTANTGEVSSNNKSIFGTTAKNTGEESSSSSKSIFGTTTTSTVEATTNSKSIFGTSTAATGAAPSNGKSIFGTAVPNSGEVSSSSKSLFSADVASSVKGQTSSFSSVFDNSAGVTEKASTIPGQVSTSKSIFGSVSTTSPSIFGVSAVSGDSALNTNKSIFGTSVTSSAAITKTPPPKIETVQSPTNSIFNTSVSNNAASSPTIFGVTGTTSGAVPTSGKSLFGATGTNSGAVPTSSKSIFGAAVTSSGTASATSSSIFGAPTQVTGALSLTTKSIFENTSASSGSATKSTTSANSQSSPFGAPSFGAGNAISTGSMFGNTASVASPFGGTTGKSVFGSAVSASSPFGTSTPISSTPFSATPFASSTNSNSVFGQVTSTGAQFNTSPTATSPFSSTTANVQSPFGSTPNTAVSPFGAVAPSVCSPFGTQSFGAGFNANTTAQSSPFGQVSTPSNVFGSSNPTSAPAFGTVSSTVNSSSPFAQTSGGMFGSFGSSSAKPAEGSFGFGSLNVGAASQGPFSKPNEGKSPFGTATFNPTTSTGSLFGASTFGNNNGNSVFGQTTFGGSSAFSSTQTSGPFSAGSGSIAQTGFGVQTLQKPSAFGASPSFGGTPAFGSAATFGGSPAFGSAPSFGSPNKVFGSPNPAPAGSAFGSANTQQSSGFGSFSSQNSLGFGSITQTPNTPGGNPTQGNGFGSFASQSTIGFGNLAQQTNNSVQNAPFSGASSFSSWR